MVIPVPVCEYLFFRERTLVMEEQIVFALKLADGGTSSAGGQHAPDSWFTRRPRVD